MSQETIRRAINPESRVISEQDGTVEFVASDETLDSYKEVIRAKGWRFDNFAKNSPFVDSHNYNSVADVIGTVIDFGVKKGRLLETVRFAIDVPENELAKLAFRMYATKHLKAVSVGFWPVRVVTRWDSDLADYRKELEALGIEEGEDAPRTIYQEVQQIELSAVVVGANPNALARAYKACVISDRDIDFLSNKRSAVVPADEPINPATARRHPRQASRLAFHVRLLADRL